MAGQINWRVFDPNEVGQKVQERNRADQRRRLHTESDIGFHIRLSFDHVAGIIDANGLARIPMMFALTPNADVCGFEIAVQRGWQPKRQQQKREKWENAIHLKIRWSQTA